MPLLLFFTGNLNDLKTDAVSFAVLSLLFIALVGSDRIGAVQIFEDRGKREPVLSGRADFNN